MSKDRAAQLIDAGIWLRLSGDLEGARKLFERAAKLDPENLRAQQLLSGAPDTALAPPGLTPDSPFAPVFRATGSQIQPEPSAARVEMPVLEPPAPPSIAPVVDGSGSWMGGVGADELDWGRATGYESPKPFPAPEVQSPSTLAPPKPASDSRATSATISIGSEVPVQAPRSTPPIFDLSSRHDDDEGLSIELDEGFSPTPTPPQFVKEASTTPPPLGSAPSGVGHVGEVAQTSDRVPQSSPSDLFVDVSSPSRSGSQVASQSGLRQPPADSVPPTEELEASEGTTPLHRSTSSEGSFDGGVDVSLSGVVQPESGPVTGGDRGTVDTARIPTIPELPLTSAPEPVGVAWAWSTAERGPGSAVVRTDSRPLPQPSPLTPNATSAWDARDNPGIKLSAVVGETKALEMIAADAEQRRALGPESSKSEVRTLLRGARDLLDLDDHTGAIELILKAQQLAPEDPDVLALRVRSEKTLLTMFESKLGKLDTIPRVLLKEDEIIWLNLDHRAGFVLAQIDGTVNFDDLFAVSGMSRLDTARILAQLVDEGVISRGT